MESDGFLPRGYSQWEQGDRYVPGTILVHFRC
jgi:hypothetical protein